MDFPSTVGGPLFENIKVEDSASSGRVKGLQIVKPIVYGSVSEPLPVIRSDGRTHKWTVFLKPYHNEDFSMYIKKVTFKLHDSYENCNRTVSKVPFEVSETGWGEFEVSIKIYFRDRNEKPIIFYHVLQLFHTGPNANDPDIVNTPVIKEVYDEIVFQDPTILMRNLLTKKVFPYTRSEWKHSTDFEKKKLETTEKLTAAKTNVQKEIEEEKAKLKLAQETLKKFREEVAKLKKSNPVPRLPEVE